jgi:dual specificity MAP kinase phosphatase
VYSTSTTATSTRAAFALAEKFKLAIERKAAERKKRYEEAGVEVVWVRHGGLGKVSLDETRHPVKIVSPGMSQSSSTSDDSMEVEDTGVAPSDNGKPRAYLVAYNVFVMTDPIQVLARKAPWLINRIWNVLDFKPHQYGGNYRPRIEAEDITRAKEMTQACARLAPDVLPEMNFDQRERDEMRELTKATEILGDCVFLGNINDVPLPSTVAYPPRSGTVSLPDVNEVGWYFKEPPNSDPFDNSDNPLGFDICIECRDSMLPTPLIPEDELRAANTHLAKLDALWSARSSASKGRSARPAPSASNIVHFSFPATIRSFMMPGLIRFLDFLSSKISPEQRSPSTRPMRVLITSNDGYTETSVLALCVLMKELGINLPEAYLELQVRVTCQTPFIPLPPPSSLLRVFLPHAGRAYYKDEILLVTSLSRLSALC